MKLTHPYLWFMDILDLRHGSQSINYCIIVDWNLNTDAFVKNNISKWSLNIGKIDFTVGSQVMVAIRRNA